MKETLGFKAKNRQIYPSKSGSGSELRERVTAYNADLGTGNDGLSQNNGYLWNQNGKFQEGFKFIQPDG